MITHLLDSDRLIDYLDDRRDARSLLAPFIEARQIATSIIVLGEIHEGLLGDAQRSLKLSSLNDFLGAVPALTIDPATAQVFADIRSALRRSGQIINDHDIWIAATALQHDLTLISRDRHFDRIPGLKRHV